MQIIFSKYQGTGNDFVMLDNRSGEYDNLSVNQVSMVCDRRFGIGADGLIKINATATADFEVDYYNADGSKSFCGNGARCSVAFAKKLGLLESSTKFTAIDGDHEAFILEDAVHLKMGKATIPEAYDNDYIIDTGSPHYIRFCAGGFPDIFETGREIRYSDSFRAAGINVNFVRILDVNRLEVATYERGVEAETFSCGTGVTAAAIVYCKQQLGTGKHRIEIATKGGNLAVELRLHEDGSTSDVWLIGPGTFVFDGSIEVA